MPRPHRGLKRPRTEKQLALADARYEDNKKLESRYGRRFQAKALARLEKLVPEAGSLKYGHLFMIAYTLATCIDNQRNNNEATDAIARAHNRELAEMRKLRNLDTRKAYSTA